VEFILFITRLFSLTTTRGTWRLRGRSRFRNSGDGNVRNDDASSPVRRLRQHHIRMLSRWRYYRKRHKLCGMRRHRYQKLHRVLLWMLSRWSLRRYARHVVVRYLPPIKIMKLIWTWLDFRIRSILHREISHSLRFRGRSSGTRQSRLPHAMPRQRLRMLRRRSNAGARAEQRGMLLIDHVQVLSGQHSASPRTKLLRLRLPIREIWLLPGQFDGGTRIEQRGLRLSVHGPRLLPEPIYACYRAQFRGLPVLHLSIRMLPWRRHHRQRLPSSR